MRIALLASLILACIAASAAAHAANAAWPLEYRDESTNRFIWDKRTQPLIEAKTHRSFAPELRAALGGPPGPVIVKHDRYFTASACVSHDCLRKGFFWLDMEGGPGLGAIFRGSYPTNEGPLELDSTKIRGEVPEGARLAILQWLEEVKAVPTSVEFTDASGIRRSLPADSFRPPQRFVPPSKGPSFDCSRASTSIESLLCTDPDLAAQDLMLSEQYKGMLVTSGDLPTRRQLAALQQHWLQQRNAACEHAAAPKECLAAMYRAQSYSLQQWIPLPSSPQDMAGLAKTGFQSGEWVYQGRRHGVNRQHEANARTASFNTGLAAHQLAALDSCALLVDLPAGTAHGDHSFGAVCSQPVKAEKQMVLVCDDDMVGNFGFRVVDKRKVSIEELARFVAEKCVGG